MRPSTQPAVARLVGSRQWSALVSKTSSGCATRTLYCIDSCLTCPASSLWMDASVAAQPDGFGVFPVGPFPSSPSTSSLPANQATESDVVLSVVARHPRVDDYVVTTSSACRNSQPFGHDPRWRVLHGVVGSNPLSVNGYRSLRLLCTPRIAVRQGARIDTMRLAVGSPLLATPSPPKEWGCSCPYRSAAQAPRHALAPAARLTTVIPR